MQWSVWTWLETELLLQDGGTPKHGYHNTTSWRCAVFVSKSYGSKAYPQRNAAHVLWTLPVMSKQSIIGFRNSRKGERVSKTNVESVVWWRLPRWQRILRSRFPGTCETVGQVFKFVWRLCWKINVVCVSLSPIVSFQSHFVSYLLTFSHIMKPE
jgi:hypothetical protein